MAIGVVSKLDFDNEVTRLINHGRGSKQATPQVIREIIAIEKVNGASAHELSKTFNVSESSVSAYAHGANSTSSYYEPNHATNKAIEKERNEISDLASVKLRDAIHAIVFDSDTKPNIASAVARDMSSIMKNMNPSPDVQINNQQVIVYKPRMKEEEDYEVIQVNE